MSDITRALAERLGMLADCEACCEGLLCPVCDSTYLRLPTEAEARAAILEVGPDWVETRQSAGGVTVLVAGMFVVFGAEAGEAEQERLATLGLLRALEACRGA